MAGRKKTAGEDDETAGDQSFESSLAELEEIVAAMEEQQLPLEELVSRYEKGSKLLSRCENVLASARKRLQTISARAGTAGQDGAGADDELPGAPADHDDDDDIRLF